MKGYCGLLFTPLWRNDEVPQKRPRLLDLFCGAGGAAVGYERAGFEVVGVDIRPQPRYPFAFVEGDALAFVAAHGAEFDVIHASPPCQGYSVCASLPQCRKDYPMLIEETRRLLQASGRPFVIENVVGAPLVSPVRLCGTMFGLTLFRHRLFESNVFLEAPDHEAHTARIGFGGFCCVAGHGDAGKNVRVAADHRTKASWARAMEIDWMHKPELAQAIPPAYTEFLGGQVKRQLMRGKTE